MHHICIQVVQNVCLNSAYFSLRVPEDCKSVQCRVNAKIYVEHVNQAKYSSYIRKWIDILIKESS